ncbi:MAG: exodeoxyribonuclease V subunit gamma [Geodermatophilaceae bacterium]|nr:exodeoxyribonuclease V subunit gamma [Geodermatophilaceae bacterium]
MLALHRAERSTDLVVALAQILTVPLPDPFTAEVIAVPAKGIERWLTQRLSTVLGADANDGVAANIAFPSPTRLVDEAIGAASGIDADDDPWSTSRQLWTLLDVIDACLDEPWCGVLQAHLTGEHRVTRRYATAAHLTRLWRMYAAERPQMLVDWAAGRDTDGAGGELPADLTWQAHLWRRLRDHIGSASPAERLAAACEQLRAQPGLSDLPERFSLYGPTRLTTEQLAVLDALAEQRDVHLWLPHPSPAMWATLTGRPTPVRRRDDTSALAVRHPLLASLARDTRELQQRLSKPAGQDLYHGDDPRPATLLEHLQADVRADRTPAHTAKPDGTVQVHACHGPPRQVEVLREALLHLFQQDPTLEPRDVLVMCPDVEAYAPLVRAAFGQGNAGGHPGHRLRVRLADRSLRQTNPLLDTVAGLLDLADGRVTASQVLDLAASGPVRRMFGFDDDDLEQLRTWVSASGVRWGIGDRQRKAFGLSEVPQNTWTTGLDRILLGVTADEAELTWLGRALPLDDVDSGDIDLAGRLAELIDRLDAVLWRLHGPQPASMWTSTLGWALELLTEVPDADAWQRTQARRELASSTEYAGTTDLRLPDVRAMLAGRLAGQPTRANFRTGELTIATLVPMRSVPHRVVALLGLDDEVFPRGAGIDGDDVLARDPCLGERDRRSEDRQLLLDAVMSAGERLLVLYTGADPVSGQRRPPAVPLGELLDVITATAGQDIVRRHPLQPFDPANFNAAEPFSHDRGALTGAHAAQRPRSPEPAFLPAPLPRQIADVTLAALISFVVHPTQAFLRQRLGVYVPDADDAVLDALGAELDPLSRWDVGDRMLAARLKGVDASDFRQAEWRRGTLPPLRLGAELLTDVEQAVDALAAVSLGVHAGTPAAVDVTVDLGGGRLLTGTVTGVHGHVLASTSYSRLAPKHRLAAWVKLLAVTATRPGAWQAITTGRGPYSRPAWRSTLTAPEDAAAVLRDLVALRDDGLTRPLPITTGASAAYADRRERGDSTQEAMDGAAKQWSAMFGDKTDRHLGYVYGPEPDLAQLLTEPGDAAEPTRFAVLARRLWAPLLRAAQQGAP